jgi:hypothetical protein
MVPYTVTDDWADAAPAKAARDAQTSREVLMEVVSESTILVGIAGCQFERPVE